MKICLCTEVVLKCYFHNEQMSLRLLRNVSCFDMQLTLLVLRKGRERIDGKNSIRKQTQRIVSYVEWMGD